MALQPAAASGYPSCRGTQHLLAASPTPKLPNPTLVGVREHHSRVFCRRVCLPRLKWTQVNKIVSHMSLFPGHVIRGYHLLSTVRSRDGLPEPHKLLCIYHTIYFLLFVSFLMDNLNHSSLAPYPLRQIVTTVLYRLASIYKGIMRPS